MDRVRFGRALGYGARHAIKAVASAVDAAAAESPAKKSAPAAVARPQAAAQPQILTPGAPRAATKVAGVAAQARSTSKGVKRGTKRFGEAVWGPFVRLSGVLWLEVTGVFFGIFALVAAGAIWKFRGDWHSTATNGEGHQTLLAAVVMLVVFGYFCLSSFMRAKRRERKR
jgi:hypothetical protein